jgi:hypothetical protein
MDRLIFAIIATMLLSFIIWVTYRTKSVMFATMFVFSLLIFLAFYTFQWGPLGEFEVKGFSAQAKFIREKRQQVETDAGAIATIKQEASQILSRLRLLEERIQPRTFTPVQEKAFLDVLRTASPGKIALYWLGSNLEAENFGKHLAVLLESAGWAVEKAGYGADPTPVGLEIHVQSTESAPPYTATLREAFKSTGYETSIVEKRDSPMNLSHY